MRKGDIVTGTKESDERYWITNSRATMRVISVHDNCMFVEIISPRYHGERYEVEIKYFKKLGVTLK